MAERIRGLDPSIWVLGLVVWLAAWSIEFGTPSPGLDSGWQAGIYMAAHDGLSFGDEVIFTFGPLGFMKFSVLYFDGLASLAFVYSALTGFAFVCALIWTLRSRLGVPLACLVAFIIEALLPIDPAIGLATLWAIAVVGPRSPRRALSGLITVGAVFAAAEILMKLSTGPVILVIFLVALVGARATARQVGTFVAILFASTLALWLIAGQSLADVPGYIANSAQIVLGYNAAMAMYEYAFWPVPALILGVVLIGLWSWFGGEYADRRARVASTAILVLVGFSWYKQSVVRIEPFHLAIGFAGLLVLWCAVPTVPIRKYGLLAGMAVFAGLTFAANSPSTEKLNVFDNLDDAQAQIRLLFDSSGKEKVREDGRFAIQLAYAVEPPLIEEMEGRSVSIDPWDIGIVWAYGLDWAPLPVFQNYSAYTSHLDELNAEAVAAPDGPERILKASVAANSIDYRNPNWDPPAQAIETLCHFRPGATSERWQVLMRVENRCGPAEPAGKVASRFGETVEVPAPGPSEVVFAKVDGAGPGPFGLLRGLLYKPSATYAALPYATYRLIPATAGDGLLLRAGRRVADDDGLFSQVPETDTIRIDGAGGDLEYAFYRMEVRPPDTALPPETAAPADQ